MVKRLRVGRAISDFTLSGFPGGLIAVVDSEIAVSAERAAIARVTFPHAGPGEAPCSAYGIIGADDRQRVGLDAQGL